MLVKFYYHIIAPHICLRLCYDWLKGSSKNRKTDTAASKRKGKKATNTKQMTSWTNCCFLLYLIFTYFTLVLNSSISAIFPLFTCHCDSFHLCWTSLLLHMTKGECCRGSELNRILFDLKEFLKTGHFFPDPLEIVRRATLFSFPYVAIYTSAFLNVTCPFWTMLVIMPKHRLNNAITQQRRGK